MMRRRLIIGLLLSLGMAKASSAAPLELTRDAVFGAADQSQFGALPIWEHWVFAAIGHNVRVANTISLLQRFVMAGKTNVDFMVYPRRVDSIAGVPQRRHLYEHMLDWWPHHI